MTNTELIRYSLFTVLALYGVYTFLHSEWQALFMAGITLIFSLIPVFLQKLYGFKTPESIQSGVALFMFGTIFLGETAYIYERIWWWDLFFHMLAGLGFGMIGYIVLILTYRKQNARVAPLFTSLFAISYSLGASALWEMFEFAVDELSKTTNMQKGLEDTMWDLIVGFVGALLSALVGYRYLIRKDSLGIEAVIEEGVKNNGTH